MLVENDPDLIPVTGVPIKRTIDHRQLDPHPKVQGKCPSCGAESLFLGSGGYVTCSVIGCKAPGAATDLLKLGGAGEVTMNMTIDGRLLAKTIIHAMEEKG